MPAKEHARRKRPRIRDRIFDGEIDLQSVRGDAAQPLGDVEPIRMRMPGTIEPGLVVESHGVDHERVAIPMADGIAHISRREIWRMLAAIGVDMANAVIV